MNLKLLVIIGIVLVVLSGVLYAFFRLPKTVEVMGNPSDLAWLQNRLIAHRGLHDDNIKVPENSMPAFKGAIEKGFIIELDVAMTKDQKLVVYHDKKLRRGLGVDRYLLVGKEPAVLRGINEILISSVLMSLPVSAIAPEALSPGVVSSVLLAHPAIVKARSNTQISTDRILFIMMHLPSFYFFIY